MPLHEQSGPNRTSGVASLVALLLLGGPIALYFHARPTAWWYDRLVRNDRLIGLTLDEASEVVGYPAQAGGPDPARASFYLEHLDMLGWTWILVRTEDGKIVEAELFSD